ncbi:hypothetical protein [Bradyrhizobium sp. SYSU BS000235]|uniref:hypothetical protein n=1 Tax=Bradyrhizobium sp. SYSU BS000235 TaxID=3411332 RepID=UPI003C76A008
MSEKPLRITFGVFYEDVPNPTITIRRTGTVVQHRNFMRMKHIRVLIEQPAGSIDTTQKQQKTVKQLIHIALELNGVCAVTFIPCAPLWCYETLRSDDWDSFEDMMELEPVDSRKLFLRRAPPHAKEIRRAQNVEVVRAQVPVHRPETDG